MTSITLLAFLKSAFSGWRGVGLGGLGTCVTVFSYLAIGDGWRVRLPIILGYVAIALIWCFAAAGFRFFRYAAFPISVRIVQEGTGYYDGKHMIVLDRRPWLQPGHVLGLYVRRGSVDMPLGVLRVEHLTHGEGYPVAVLIAYYGKDDQRQYLLRSDRWGRLLAHSLVDYEILVGGSHS